MCIVITQKVGKEMGEFLRKETNMATISETGCSVKKRMTFAVLSLSSATQLCELEQQNSLRFSLLFCTDTQSCLQPTGTPTPASSLRVTGYEAKPRLLNNPCLFRGGQFSIYSDFLAMCSDVIHRRKAGLRVRLKDKYKECGQEENKEGSNTFSLISLCKVRVM